jgi:nucleoside-diphosphate-sugar epimerase
MEGLNKRRVLVTGATGFLGSHLCRNLVGEGAEVHAICRPNSQVAPDAVRIWEGGLDDAAQVRNVVKAVAPDYVFHLAAVTSAARELAAVLPTFQANLVTTVNLLAAVAEVGCERVVLAGSLEEPQDGDSIPSSPYAASKWAATAYSRMFWQLYKTPATVARIFMVYGPAQRDVKKLIPATILSLLQGKEPQITSGARQVDWIFVSDVVAGLIALSQARDVEGQAVDLGTGILTSVREVAQCLARLINPVIRPTFGSLPERPGEQVRCANLARTQAVLGWKPAVQLENGLRQTIDYYRQRPELYCK